MDAFRSALARVADAKAIGQANDEVFAKSYPIIHAFLTTREVDGVERMSATLNIFTEEGRWKCFLNDRETEKYLVLSGDSFQGLLRSLEKALGSEGADWRGKGQFNGKKRK